MRTDIQDITERLLGCPAADHTKWLIAIFHLAMLATRRGMGTPTPEHAITDPGEFPFYEQE
jgi:hypothetical protein